MAARQKAKAKFDELDGIAKKAHTHTQNLKTLSIFNYWPTARVGALIAANGNLQEN